MYRQILLRASKKVENTVQEVITGLVGEVLEAEYVWLEERKKVSVREGKLVC